MKKSTKFFLKYLKGEKLKILFAFFLIFCVSLADLSYGYICGGAIEAATLNNIKLCFILFSIYFGIQVVSYVIIDSYTRYLMTSIQLKVINRVNNDAYLKAINMPSKAFEEMKSGEFINRITNDAESVTDSFMNIFDIILRIIGSIIIYIYIFLNSYVVALFILIFVLLFGIVVKVFNPKLKKINENVKSENDNYTSKVSETIRGIREIKTLGIKNNLFKEVKKTLKSLFNLRKEELKIEIKYNFIIGFLRTFLEVGTFIITAYLLYKGDVKLSFFIAMTYYVYRYMWLIDNIKSFSKQFQKTKVAIERIGELLDSEKYPTVEFGNKKLSDKDKKIEFKNVTFGYDDNITLDKFNITFEANKKIAIVGKSGQGKSTIFNLLTRIFDTTEGEILIDGINIEDISEESLRKNVSIIRQDPFIFNKTIKENFLLLNNKLTLEEIRKFAKKAYIDDYIMSLKDKYDTVIGEGGVNLSGGQKQRLSIARTLAKGSKIILFDEATSALDNESQDYIKKSINELVKDHTVIIIAHRLSTIVDSDLIYVINDGKVVDKGTHNELLEKSSYYKKLYQNES